MDLGLTAEIDLPQNSIQGSFFGQGKRQVRVSMSVTDIGRLSFTENAAAFRNKGTLRWDGISIDQDRLRNEFDSNLGDYFTFVLEDSIGTDVYLNLNKESKDRITGALPAMFNMGFQLTAGRLITAMDFGKGFNNSGINSKTVSVGMGVEYRAFNVWPIRAGFNSGGNNPSSWTLGTGLMTRHYDFNVGLMFVGNSQSSGAWLAGGLSAFTFRF
jgi:hypothetical protein